jgi:hypothetical protein
MKRGLFGLIVLGTLLVLLSCATAPGPRVDWNALEAAATIPGSDFLPEVEAANIRIPLFFVASKEWSNNADTMMLHAPQFAPFGVDLGNGLAIDSSGSVFLDVLKLLRIDTARNFRVACRADETSKEITTLARDESGTRLDSPRGRGSIVRTADGLALKPASGKNIMTVSNAGGAFAYNTTIAFDPSSEMKATDSEIVVKTGLQLGSGLQIQWQDGSVAFNPRGTPTWPVYTVTRRGDAYLIEYRSSSALLVFKLYYSGPTIYLVRNGFILRTITISDSSVMVNGQEIVTYSRG